MFLRSLFEGLGDLKPRESEDLIWSPTERDAHSDEAGGQRTTDLEDWFEAFSRARNRIVHEGAVGSFAFGSRNPKYSGPILFTAERLFRESVRVLLSKRGYGPLWRSARSRLIHDAAARLQQRVSQARSGKRADAE